MKNYEVNDRVASSSKFSNGLHGRVWKISEKGVHVRFGEGEFASFQVFHYSPQHHSQSPIAEIINLENE